MYFVECVSKIIIIKSVVWAIIHCLGLGHEKMVCAVCLSIFLRTYILSISCEITRYKSSPVIWAEIVQVDISKFHGKI